MHIYFIPTKSKDKAKKLQILAAYVTQPDSD